MRTRPRLPVTSGGPVSPSGQVDVGSHSNATEDTGHLRVTYHHNPFGNVHSRMANDLGGAATEISRVGTFTAPPHGYTSESASTVVAPVTSGAGAGKL